MRFVPRRALPHEVPGWVGTGQIYFFTLSTAVRNSDVCTRPETAAHLLSAVRHYHNAGRWYVHLFLVMPDHVHALISFPCHERMRDVWRDWKRFTARRTGIAWQRDVFEHRVRNDEEFQLKASYIRENPVRKSLVRAAEEWAWRFEA